MTAPTKSINLALQGGGAHGAYTWGVLDALLEDGRLAIKAISGTSAGAMNAVVLAEGLAEGGIEGARKQLEQFWRGISDGARYSPIQRSWLERRTGGWDVRNTPGFWWLDTLTRMASPYQLNPMNINPVVKVLGQLINFDIVQRLDSIKLFISATNVRTGKVKVFENHELTAQHIMASACLPDYFQAVEIDGDAYWDGGYMGNPSLFPFFYQETADDIVLVQVNPIERAEIPQTAQDIRDRVNEISFNGALLGELRAIAFVQKLLDDGRLQGSGYRRLHMHLIHEDDALNTFNAASKMNAEWDFLCHLRDLGRQSAKKFLADNFENIGVRGTLNIRAALL